MRSLIWIVPLSVVLTALLVWGPCPLGIPGEWTWERLPAAAAGWPSMAVGALVYLVIVWAGQRRLEMSTSFERAAWLLALATAGFGWLWVVQEASPNPAYRLSKAGFVLFYPGPSGYFTTARQQVNQRQRFLQNYESFAAEGDVLHAGTHPPGLIAAYWLLMDSARWRPLSETLHATEPDSARAAFDVIAELTRSSAERLTKQDRAVLWLAMLLVQLSAACTCFPLYGLVSRQTSPLAGWWTAALWPAVPAVAMFLPKSDALLAFIATAFLWTWLTALSSSRTSLFLAGTVAAGIVYWLGLCISLAMLPVAALAAGVTIWETCAADPAERPGRLRAASVGAGLALAAFVGLCLVVLWQARLNLAAVWLANYHNHARFYEQFPRTWWKWLLVNPLELTVAIGAPVIVLAVSGLLSLRQFSWRHRSAVIGVAVWTVLWLSGKNSGEAARLWIFLMPWWCWLAGLAFERLREQHARWPLIVIGCQLLVSAIVATGVSGFLTPP